MAIFNGKMLVITRGYFPIIQCSNSKLSSFTIKTLSNSQIIMRVIHLLKMVIFQFAKSKKKIRRAFLGPRLGPGARQPDTLTINQLKCSNYSAISSSLSQIWKEHTNMSSLS